MRCTKPGKGSTPSSDFTAVFCCRVLPLQVLPRWIEAANFLKENNKTHKKLPKAGPNVPKHHAQTPPQSSEQNKVQPKVQPKVGTNPMSQNQKG